MAAVLRSRPGSSVFLEHPPGSAWLERPEARILRLIESLDDAIGTLVCCVPALPDRFVDPDPVARPLLQRADEVWFWERELTPPSSASSPVLCLLESGSSTWSRASQAGLSRITAALGGAALLLLVMLVCWRAWLGTDSLVLGDSSQGLLSALFLSDHVARALAGDGPLLFIERLYWPRGAWLPVIGGGVIPYVVAGLLQCVAGTPDHWNGFVILSLWLNGLSMAWLARRLGADRLGALGVGAAWALAPPLLDQVTAGEPEFFFASLLPLAVGLSLDALDGRARGHRAGVALALTLACGWILGAWTAGVVLLLAVHRWWRYRHGRRRLWRIFGTMLRWGALGLLPGIPVMAQLVRGDMLHGSSGVLPHELGDGWRARLVVDALAQHSWRPDDPGSFVLVGLMALTLLAAWTLTPRRAVFPMVLALGAGVLALGPWLEPDLLFDHDWRVLPHAFAWRLPLVSVVGPPERFGILAVLGACLAAAPMLGELRRRAPRIGGAAAPIAAMCLASVTALRGGIPATSLDVSNFWEGLSPEAGAVLRLPMGVSGDNLYPAMVHGLTLVGGPGESAAVLDQTPYWRTLTEVPGLAPFVDPELGYAPGVDELRAAREAGLAYVVMDVELIHVISQGDRPDSDELARLPMLVDLAFDQPIMSGGPVQVYRLPSSE
ncbi:MAG TPA: hypothetical protein QGF58_28990 [Myxococcota bacterium]|nr:hypothetical protein [Myxococcota bacterium]